MQGQGGGAGMTWEARVGVGGGQCRPCLASASRGSQPPSLGAQRPGSRAHPCPRAGPIREPQPEARAGGALSRPPFPGRRGEAMGSRD